MALIAAFFAVGMIFSPVVFAKKTTAGTQPRPAEAPFIDNVPRITVQELKAKMDRQEDVVILDVRAGRDYDKSRDKIKGAVRISIFQLDDRYRELPINKEIVTYCT
jgi:hypothetical protein